MGAIAVTAKQSVEKNEVRRPPGLLVAIIAGILLLLTMIAGIAIGPLGLDAATVLRVLGSKVGLVDPATLNPTSISVVWDIRFPRVILAVLVGAALAIAGAALQGLFGNALADPGVIGVTSGASLGAIAAIVLGLTMFGTWTVPVAAFVAGTLTTALIYVLARPGKNSGGGVQLLLVGIAITAITGSFNGFFTYISTSTELEAIVFWAMGSLNRAEWSAIAVSLPLFLIGMALLMWLASSLDVLSLGERQARHVGLNVPRTRILLVIGAAMVVGAAVALAGSIGFVGLVIPHIIRLIIGPGHRWLLPISAISGALMIVLADIAARTLNPPTEIPIGLFTGIVGGPFFLWLIWRARSKEIA